MISRFLCVVVLLASTATFVFSAEAEKTTKPAASGGARFALERSLPAKPLVFVKIQSGRDLAQGFASTLFGRMATHPGTRAAFQALTRALEAQIQTAWAPIEQVIGKKPEEVLALFGGETSFAFAGMSPQGAPRIALAIELGTQREAILSVVDRLGKAFAEETGAPLAKRKLGTLEATIWPTPAGEAAQAVLGDHLVFALDASFLAALAEAASKPTAPAGTAVLDPDLVEILSPAQPQVLAVVDVAGLLGLFFGPSGMPPDDEAQGAFRVLGVDGITTAAFALGFRDGGAEWTAHLGVREGTKGIFGVLRDSLKPAGDPTAAYAKMPGSVAEVQGFRVAAGSLFQGVDAAIRKGYPSAVEALDGAYREFEESVGISVERDLFTLGELTAHGFAVGPAAGGLFADQVLLVRSEEMEGYWKLADKLAKALGAEWRTIETGGSPIAYLSAAKPMNPQEIADLFSGGTPPSPRFAAMFLGGIARTDLGDGWTAVSNLPQALVRLMPPIAGGDPFSKAKDASSVELRQLAAASLRSASYAIVSRDGRGLLAAYNSVLSLAGAFGPFLSMVGVDTARIPPAEVFLDGLRSGWLRLETGPRGLTLRGCRLFETSGGALAAVGVGGVVAGFLVPTLMTGRTEAYKVQCMNNLKQIYVHSMEYGDRSGTRVFPYSESGSFAAFQLLLEDKNVGVFSPRIFVCQESGLTPAQEEADGTFRLSEETCGYEIIPKKLRLTASRQILLYDKTPCHSGGRNVCFTDGSIQFMHEAEFQEALAKALGANASEKAGPPSKKTLVAPSKAAPPKAVVPKAVLKDPNSKEKLIRKPAPKVKATRKVVEEPVEKPVEKAIEKNPEKVPEPETSETDGSK